MTWPTLALIVVAVCALACVPAVRLWVVRNVTTKICPACFERFPRRASRCPTCRTSTSDFGGVAPPSSPLS